MLCKMGFSRRWLWRMPLSGILRRVALGRTNVSEERGAPIIRVTTISELGTLAVTSKRSKHAACLQRVHTAVNLGFLDRSRYFSFKIAPKLSPRDQVNTVPDQLLFRKSCSPGDWTRNLLICSQELWHKPLEMAAACWLQFTCGLQVTKFICSFVLIKKLYKSICSARSRKLRLTTVGDPPRWPRDTPISTKVGTKFRRQVAVVSRYCSLAN
jgi:hypothetical protein